MRVKRLKMQSFRGIGDLALDFDEKEPTVFVSINGWVSLVFLIVLLFFYHSLQENFIELHLHPKWQR